MLKISQKTGRNSENLKEIYKKPLATFNRDWYKLFVTKKIE